MLLEKAEWGVILIHVWSFVEFYSHCSTGKQIINTPLAMLLR
jgi:hypothetical protein